MEELNQTKGRPEGSKPTYHVRLPGFVPDEPVGLGDVIKRITYAVGIRPCSGCQQRADRMNQWIVFTK